MKIEYIENGDHWEYRTAGVITYYREITKECYDSLSSMTYRDREEIIEAGLSDSDKWGYGYYGHELANRKKGEVNGKFYLGKKIGSSCD